jgi:hypothetical protein
VNCGDCGRVGTGLAGLPERGAGLLGLGRCEVGLLEEESAGLHEIGEVLRPVLCASQSNAMLGSLSLASGLWPMACAAGSGGRRALLRRMTWCRYASGKEADEGSACSSTGRTRAVTQSMSYARW